MNGPGTGHGPANAGSPKLYAELASWWPLFSPPGEYAEEAASYEQILLGACKRTPRTLLELGSGGGNNASFLKARFEMVLVEPSPGMIQASKALNPECEHVQGDMRTVRLDRRFDCIFIHDAIVYMTTESDLRRAIETAFVHCEPGGAALFAPDHVRENFRTLTEHGGSDGLNEGVRYLAWAWDPDPVDTTYIVDYVILLREKDGAMKIEYDRHVEGLFARADWLRFISEAGFESSVVPESDMYEVFVGVKPE